jgi:hypothetical protein
MLEMAGNFYLAGQTRRRCSVESPLEPREIDHVRTGNIMMYCYDYYR